MTVDQHSPAEAIPGDEPGYAHRVRILQRKLAERGLAAVALAGPEDIYYLTGLDHWGYFAFTLLVVPADGEPALLTRAMETPTIRALLPWCRHVTFGDGHSPAAAVAGLFTGVAGTVALDLESMFFPPAIADDLRALRPDLRWVTGSNLLTALRAIKSDWEIRQVRRAAALSDRALEAGIAALRPGAGEQEVAAAAYHAMIHAGGQPPGFPPLIRPTTILDREHVSWSGGRAEAGQGWFFELSASVRRYHAPLSRTVYLGPPPTAAAEAAGTALAGLAAALEALRPGVRTGDVYRAWERAVAGPVTPAEPLRHHCGYLVGIGFPPSWVGGGEVLGIRPGGDTLVAPGMTFHLMSWVTRPIGHVVSDTVLVTAEGAELLTTAPHEPLTTVEGH